jgi:hypothetical protein
MILTRFFFLNKKCPGLSWITSLLSIDYKMPHNPSPLCPGPHHLSAQPVHSKTIMFVHSISFPCVCHTVNLTNQYPLFPANKVRQPPWESIQHFSHTHFRSHILILTPRISILGTMNCCS